MPVIQSIGVLADLSPGWYPSGVYTGVRMYDQYSYDYATLYRTQPNVRTCVDFLARNIAQLGLHVFQRVSETDRVRLRDHGLAQLLAQPMPAQFKVTRYRLIESLVADMGIYFNAYWLKVLQGDRLALMRVPPPYVEVAGGLMPTGYVVTVGTRRMEYGPEAVVHFRGYNAESATTGLSPLETLRRVLAEEHAMGDYREHFWQNAARQAGIIERPSGAPEWSTAARARFKAEFEALYSGGDNSGKTAILEEGMTWKEGTFNAQESEYLGGRKLTREECARAYHIPLPMVGILDHATFSNIKEQHKNLYQDSLGPWLAMLEQDIELQLLPDFGDTAGVYVEFNIAEKLQGSFEEQAASMQAAVGRPWMTANEARARFNMPSLDGDADELVTPLNVLVGGMASPQDASPKSKVESLESGSQGFHDSAASEGRFTIHQKADEVSVDPTQPGLRKRYQEQWTRLMVRTFERQRAAVEGKIKSQTAELKSQTANLKSQNSKEMPSISVIWDAERWNAELAGDFLKLGMATAGAWAQFVAGQLATEFDDETMLPWLQENARIGAEYVNAATLAQLETAMLQDEPESAIAGVFELALGVRAAQIALSRVTALASFGSHDAARAGGLRKKTWRVNSTNPRPDHAALNGVSVGIRDTFPNGLRWPGDPRGSADDNANCECSVVFGK